MHAPLFSFDLIHNFPIFSINCLQTVQFSLICFILSKPFLQLMDFANYNSFLIFLFATNIKDQPNFNQDFQHFCKMEYLSIRYQSIFSYRKSTLGLNLEFWEGSFCLPDTSPFSVSKYCSVIAQIFFALIIFVLMTQLAYIKIFQMECKNFEISDGF